jgi:hypothetical protein
MSRLVLCTTFRRDPQISRNAALVQSKLTRSGRASLRPNRPPAYGSGLFKILVCDEVHLQPVFAARRGINDPWTLAQRVLFERPTERRLHGMAKVSTQRTGQALLMAQVAVWMLNQFW